MNEKLKQLAEQATEVSEWLSGNCSPDAPDLAKFAELIVRQCIKSTLSLRDIAIDNEWDLDETFHMIVDTIVKDLDMQHIFRGEQ